MKRDFGTTSNFFHHQFGKLQHGELTGISNIDRTADTFCLHEADKTFDKVVNIAKAASLAAIAINRQIVPAKRLNDEVRDDTAIIRTHPWPISVEDTNNTDVHIVLAVIIKEEGLRDTLPLIVT